MSILSWLENEFNIIEADVQPAIAVIKEDLPAIIIAAFQALLSGFEAGTPYGTILKTALDLVESQGIKAGEQAVQAGLLQAEGNLIVAGTPAPITVAVAQVAAAATPASSDTAAVVAAQAVISSAVTTANTAS